MSGQWINERHVALHQGTNLPDWHSLLASTNASAGESPVDIARRMNVLAICAAFAFVAAVLLGML
jgi:hypothetical protein